MFYFNKNNFPARCSYSKQKMLQTTKTSKEILLSLISFSSSLPFILNNNNFRIFSEGKNSKYGGVL